MKTFSGRSPGDPLPVPPRLSEAGPNQRRAAAWGCVVGNLVLPGIGTFIAKRRLAGVLQLVVSQSGFLLMLVWAVSYVRQWIRQGWPEGVGPDFGIGALGLILFLLAWFWSHATSIEVWHESRKSDL